MLPVHDVPGPTEYGPGPGLAGPDGAAAERGPQDADVAGPEQGGREQGVRQGHGEGQGPSRGGAAKDGGGTENRSE